MSLREIWRRLSIDTLLALPPSEFLALVVLAGIAAFLALALVGLVLMASSRR